MLTLGIETSCDETGASVVKDGREILSNTVASSLEFHKRYGGVVPEIATRYHVEVIDYVVKDSLKKAEAKLKDIDLVAVTRGPGLVGSLLVGVSFAKALSYSLDIPLIGVNHLWAHLYSGLIEKPDIRFPFIGLVVSGGHTSLVFCENAGKFKLLGQTKDDAAGEAFDKVAKVLGLGYPGGPAIERAARQGNPYAIKFAPAYLGEDSYDFSFSGIKTAVLYYIKAHRLNRKVIANIAAGFQKAVVDCLIAKAIDACKAKGVATLVVGGGVGANILLRQDLTREGRANGIDVIFPSFELSLDNAAMVAAMGYRLFKGRVRSRSGLSAEPNLRI
ncbi:MAG: tRNA (adenosine(37)-N6)-threonylcarbamoyltransferase complex transferase subunit TsaD [Candidatus Omnitrophota bacterium]|nr:tRNA (adenosine(37)-N6)-threonylcarbamoyltransferase complex transferase subunit TsaD [Candidatus Omnitrophota bacterium]